MTEREHREQLISHPLCIVCAQHDVLVAATRVVGSGEVQQLRSVCVRHCTGGIDKYHRGASNK
jgi:hypothetical protein